MHYIVWGQITEVPGARTAEHELGQVTKKEGNHN